jgi:hypothetical protein
MELYNKMHHVRLSDQNSGPKAEYIVDENVIKEIKLLIYDQWGIQENDTNYIPAPQPVSLERKDINKLVDFDYLVCVKSDGMRFLLVFYKKKSYMIDRAFKIYKIHIECSDELYKDSEIGCILDGELIKCKDDNTWSFVVHDCINSKGTNLSNSAFNSRYDEFKNILKKYILKKYKSEIRISKKTFFSFKNLKSLKKMIDDNGLDHCTDGLIFTPKNKKIGKFTQYDLFKWKPLESHTFDFRISKNSNGIMAYVNKKKFGDHPYACAQKGSKEESIFLKYLALNCPNFKDGDIVECEFDINSGIYKPIKLRTDKIYPNSFFTVNKTLVNIKENISFEELLELSGK